MSLPYHIGNGWFGGLLPATVVRHGGADRRHLLRPVVSDRRSPLMTVVIGMLLVPETYKRDIFKH